jgi:hypothetical protein
MFFLRGASLADALFNQMKSPVASVTNSSIPDYETAFWHVRSAPDTYAIEEPRCGCASVNANLFHPAPLCHTRREFLHGCCTDKCTLVRFKRASVAIQTVDLKWLFEE